MDLFTIIIAILASVAISICIYLQFKRVGSRMRLFNWLWVDGVLIIVMALIYFVRSIFS